MGPARLIPAALVTHPGGAAQPQSTAPASRPTELSASPFAASAATAPAAARRRLRDLNARYQQLELRLTHAEAELDTLR
jgi:hypothetical protein